MRGALERRQSILDYLLEVRKTTRAELSDRFGVSLRTIERDIIILSCSYPIITVQGGNGGIKIADGYYIGIRYLTVSQLALLERLSTSLTGEDLSLMREIIKTFRRPIPQR